MLAIADHLDPALLALSFELGRKCKEASNRGEINYLSDFFSSFLKLDDVQTSNGTSIGTSHIFIAFLCINKKNLGS